MSSHQLNTATPPEAPAPDTQLPEVPAPTPSTVPPPDRSPDPASAPPPSAVLTSAQRPIAVDR